MTPAEVSVRLLLALTVVIAASRLGGWAISKLGQPRVLGEIVAGILLGPSLLGAVWPDALEYLFPAGVIESLRVLAELGVVLFMFLIGVELDLAKLRGQGHKAVVISLTSIVAPLFLGIGLAIWLYPRLGGGADELGFALFIGTAMAITAFPVLARVLRETGLDTTRIGVVTITCAAVDDVSAWCLLALTVAVVGSSGFGSAAWTIGLFLVFLVLMLWIVRPLLARLPSIPMWLAVCIALVSAWVTEEIGVHAIFGAFLAGSVMPRTAKLERVTHQRLEPVVVTVLLPVFFVVVGLSTRIERLDGLYLWGIAVLFTGVAIAGKFGGATIAARVMGETWRDASAIGVLMNTRGLTELVILTVGLELGLITDTIFTIGVLMALITTFMATPLLALILPRDRRGVAPEQPSPPIDPEGNGSARSRSAARRRAVGDR